MSARAEIADPTPRSHHGFRPLRSRWVAGVAMVLPWCFAMSGAAGEFPQVTFDVAHSVACREVAPAETARADPQRKIIEATFHVSTLLERGSARDLDELLIMITSPERRLPVVGFSPETQMVTDVEGPIESTETKDVTKSIDVRLGGKASGQQGGVDLQINPTAGGGVTEGSSLKETYKKRAPKTLKLATGTIEGRHGVFFKLKQDSQSTLEGVKEFSCRFAVPKDWRADWAVVSCQARAERQEFFAKRVRSCGNATFFVGLYLQGDAEGKHLAGSLSHAPGASPAASAEIRPADPPRPEHTDPWKFFSDSRHEIERWLCGKDPPRAADAQLRKTLDELSGLSGKVD